MVTRLNHWLRLVHKEATVEKQVNTFT